MHCRLFRRVDSARREKLELEHDTVPGFPERDGVDDGEANSETSSRSNDNDVLDSLVVGQDPILESGK